MSRLWLVLLVLAVSACQLEALLSAPEPEPAKVCTVNVYWYRVEVDTLTGARVRVDSTWAGSWPVDCPDGTR